MSNKGQPKLKRARGEGNETAPPKPTKVQRTRGRPSDYEPGMVDRACLMARFGATDVEIADALGIVESRFYVWMNQYPEFKEAVRAGKELFDDRVENSMGRRAVGYTYKTEKVFSNGFRATVHEHIPPDVGAGTNWLVNRKRWSRRTETEIIVPEAAAAPGDAPSTRQLALAAIALLSAASYDAETAGGPVIEHQHVEEDLPDDDFEDL